MKKSMMKLIREQDKDYIGTIQKFNEGVILAVAGFKCQKCGAEKELQIHHLIMRKAKDYMDFWRYASCRHYWSNSIVLCKKCHVQYHKEMGKDIGENPTLSDRKINKWKKEFEENVN